MTLAKCTRLVWGVLACSERLAKKEVIEAVLEDEGGKVRMGLSSRSLFGR